MAFDPTAGPGGAIRHLADHLARLARLGSRISDSAVPYDARRAARRAPSTDWRHRPACACVLRAGGAIETRDIPAHASGSDVGAVAVCRREPGRLVGDERCFTRRRTALAMTNGARRHPTVDDVVLVNERGEITETTRANVAVRLGDQWCTPPLRCGLLPGIQRARDLADGRLVERVITVDDLLGADSVATLSSLRGWRAARVVRTCACTGLTVVVHRNPRSGLIRRRDVSDPSSRPPYPAASGSTSGRRSHDSIWRNWSYACEASRRRSRLASASSTGCHRRWIIDGPSSSRPPLPAVAHLASTYRTIAPSGMSRRAPGWRSWSSDRRGRTTRRRP